MYSQRKFLISATHLLLTFLQINKNITAIDFAKAQSAAGDAVMTRLYEYVKDDAGRIDEQIDKFTGAQASAASLTWSYANILHALHVRKQVVRKMEELNIDFK
jgi:GH15 family glucan-1,4-alpha-glucosidase